MKIHWHNIDLYRTEIGFAFFCDPKELNDYAKKNLGSKVGKNDGCCLTLKAENGHKKYLVYVKDKEDYESLVHELFHATIRILTDRGAYRKVGDDEQGAYLCGYLMFLAMKYFK